MVEFEVTKLLQSLGQQRPRSNRHIQPASQARSIPEIMYKYSIHVEVLSPWLKLRVAAQRESDWRLGNWGRQALATLRKE